MKPNLRTISFIVNDEYVDAFYAFRNENEEFHDEISFFNKDTYGMLFPIDSDYEECVDELIGYLGRYGWNLGTHYTI